MLVCPLIKYSDATSTLVGVSSSTLTSPFSPQSSCNSSSCISNFSPSTLLIQKSYWGQSFSSYTSTLTKITFGNLRCAFSQKFLASLFTSLMSGIFSLKYILIIASVSFPYQLCCIIMYPPFNVLKTCFGSLNSLSLMSIVSPFITFTIWLVPWKSLKQVDVS